MVEFTHILVPIDFGETANHAAEVAMDIAAKYGAKVALVHAFIIPAMAHPDGCELPIDAMIQSAADALSKALVQARARHPNTEALLVKGEPSEQIVAFAKEWRADLIVMGTHGHRGHSHLLLGSVAEKVVRLSPIPVLTVSSATRKERRLSP